MSINYVHQLNNEICAQEILVESQDGEQYLVNLDGEEYYENQVSNCEVNMFKELDSL
jgi:hypothetical protein